MLARIIILLCALGTLSGCASLPAVEYDYDTMRAADPPDDAGHLRHIQIETELISGHEFVGGNKVTLLRDGANAYPAMLTAIKSAKRRVDMESFLFDGEEGAKFADALIARAKAGVEVNLIYDAVGSFDSPDELFDRLRDGGVHVVEYNPVDIDGIIDVNHRDHRKILIIDGKTVFTGGINVDVIYNLKVKVKRFLHIHWRDLDPDTLPMRDTQVKIEGPVAAEFERFFMLTWRDQDGDPIPNPPRTPDALRGDLYVMGIDETPYLDRYAIYKSTLIALHLARESIHLTTAYFVPPPDLLAALKDAARRGVDVTLLLPGQTTPDIALRAGQNYYEELLEAGVKIYEYRRIVLHAKTMVIDGVWSSVGSSNLDWRSAILNDECNAIILGPAFGRQMEAMFESDRQTMKPIMLEKWQNRSFWDQLDEWRAGWLEYFL